MVNNILFKKALRVQCRRAHVAHAHNSTAALKPPNNYVIVLFHGSGYSFHFNLTSLLEK